MDWNILKARLAQSKFRSRFRLTQKDVEYLHHKGLETIRRHATDFIIKRLAPENPLNDGSQTPMRGHPVFKAQHATATCCRSCLKKWHGIKPGIRLEKTEIDLIVEIIMRWIKDHTQDLAKPAAPPDDLFSAAPSPKNQDPIS